MTTLQSIATEPSLPPGKRTSASLAKSCAALVLAATLLTACRPYGADPDTLDYDAGNAIARNKAIQTIDPWPPGVMRTNQRLDGQRAADAFDRYRNPPPPPPAAPPPATSGVAPSH